MWQPARMPQEKRNSLKFWLSVAAFGAVLLLLWWLSYRYLTLQDIKHIAKVASEAAGTYPMLVALALVLAQAISMTFSLPTKALLTVLAGALFGSYVGAPVTVVGVLAGTTLLFYGVRKLFWESARERFGKRAKALESRIRRRPILAVAGLRLVITLPYGPITIASSLSGIRYRDFIIGSLIGDLPVVILYCLAGERLTTLATTSDAVSPMTIVILAAAGIAILVGALAGKVKK